MLRAAAFLTAGAYAVHQLRYAASFGSHADEALHHHGHGYLSAVAPLATLLVAAAIGWLLWSVMRPALLDVPQVRFRRAWALSSACLISVYTVQELLEGQFSHGHPEGLAGVFGQGGWTAVPLSVVVGVAVAAVLRISHAVERAAPPALLAAPRVDAWQSGVIVVPVVALPWPALSPLALRRAGRAPPRAR
jgi:hypothetical protein